MTTQTDIQQYYGKILGNSKDLKTNACCTADSMPTYIKNILADIEPEILDRFYGCGSPIPQAIEGCTVVDLGCGTGRDAYLCAKLTGPQGKVLGIDMTEEQLAVAQNHLDAQMHRFGYKTPNVSFHQGYMEKLGDIGLEDNSVDIVISNCVINLSPDKEKVFSEIFRVLKPGGELLFSDIFVDRRLPHSWLEDPVLVGECLGGAMYREDFRRMLNRLGIADYRIVAERPVTMNNESIQEKAGPIQFSSLTIRVFKLLELEDRCEDYGQVAYYNGTIPHAPNLFQLDDHHLFETARPVPVCGNTAAMITQTRFKPHFTIVGDQRQHFGLFDCSTNSPEPSGNTPCC